MENFSVAFDPVLGGVDVESNLEVPEGFHPHSGMYAGDLLDVSFIIGDNVYCYYPAPAVVIMFDLLDFRRSVVERFPCRITLSGYPILDMFFEGVSVRFVDPVATLVEDRLANTEHICNIMQVEKALTAATNSVWQHIRTNVAKG